MSLPPPRRHLLFYRACPSLPPSRRHLRETLVTSNSGDLNKLTTCSLILLGQIFLSLGNTKVCALGGKGGGGWWCTLNKVYNLFPGFEDWGEGAGEGGHHYQGINAQILVLNSHVLFSSVACVGTVREGQHNQSLEWLILCSGMGLYFQNQTPWLPIISPHFTTWLYRATTWGWDNSRTSFVRGFEKRTHFMQNAKIWQFSTYHDLKTPRALGFSLCL